MLEGTTILHYEILELLGRGAMGTVYKARDTKLDTLRALKFIQAGFQDIAEAQSRLMREARTQAKLIHQNIAALLELEISKDQIFLVIEYVDGLTLDVYLRKHEPTFQERINLLLQIASAIHAAHSINILHRDIKPRNVLVSPDGTAKVTDFGLAKALGETSVSATGEMKGTAPYMAPEIYRGEMVSTAVDVWSLGCLAYEVLEGHPPFQGDTFETIGYRILNEDYSPLSHKIEEALPGITEFIDCCLRKDPLERYRDGQEVLSALIGITANAGISFTGLISPIASVSRLKRKRMLRGALGTAAVCALIAGWLLLQPTRVKSYQELNSGWLSQSMERSPSWDSSGQRIALLMDTGEPAIHVWNVIDTSRQNVVSYKLGAQMKFNEVEWAPNDSVFALSGSPGLYLFYPFNDTPNRLVQVDENESVNPTWSSDGRWLLYVSQPSNREKFLARVRLAQHEPKSSHQTDIDILEISGLEDLGRPLLLFEPIFINKDSQIAFIVQKQGQHMGVYVIPAEGGIAHRIMSGTLTPTCLEWDARRRVLVFYSEKNNNICRVRLPRQGEVQHGRVRILKVPDHISASISDLDYHTSTENIALTTASSRLNIWKIPLDAPGDSLQRLQTLFNANYTPFIDCSTDDELIYYAGHALDSGFRLRVHNLSSGADDDVPIALPVLLQEWQPASSPDGRYIVFVGSVKNVDAEDTRDLWIYDRHSPTIRRLTEDSHSEMCPIWDIDGETIYFNWISSDRNAPSEIRKLRLDLSNNQIRVREEPQTIHSDQICLNPLPAADGRHLIYEGNRDGESMLILLDMDQGTTIPLVKGIRPALDPSRNDVYYFRDQCLYVIKNWFNTLRQPDQLISKLPPPLSAIFFRSLTVGRDTAFAVLYESDVGWVKALQPVR